MPSTAFNYEIVEKVAVLSQSGDTTKELNNKDLIDSLTESYKNLNEVVLLDPSNLRAVIEEMTKENDQFNTEVDYVLSESNSNTFIEVDLEG